MNRLAVFIAAAATAALVSACGSSSASGDARACQMVRAELSQQSQQYTAAEAAASSPGLKHQIAELAYATSIESQPFPLGSAGLVLVSSAVTEISGMCASAGVRGISEA